MYKLSEYNFFIPLNKDNKFLIYNSISNALIESDERQVELLKNLIGINSIDILNSFFPSNIDLLINDGILISSEVDEKEIIKKRTIKLKEEFDSNKILHITLCTTNACNLRCVYCFEKEKREQPLNNNNADDVIKFLENIFINEKEKIQTLDTTWYGGEPLMNFDYLKEVSEKIILLTEKYKIKYKAGIITNGTLLTKEIINEFDSLRITNIQISIDGGRNTHNKKRIYKGGLGTYDVILKNTSMLPEKINITIRIHCDRAVINSLDELLSDLEKNGIWPQRAAYVKLNLANLTDAGDVTEEEYFKTKEFFRIKQLRYFNSWARKNGKKQSSLKIKYPSIMSPYCGTASSNYGSVIDDNGFASKCFEDVYCADKTVFHINDRNIDNKNYIDYTNYNKFTNDFKCNNCKIMPICETNCIKKHIENRATCSEWRYLLPYRLKKFYLDKNSKDN